MGLEEKVLKLRAPEFTDVVSLAKWYVEHRDTLVQNDHEKEIPSAVKIFTTLDMLGKTPKQKQRHKYFRRLMYSLDYILDTTIQDNSGSSTNLMRSEIERILDGINIETCFSEGHFSYNLLKRILRVGINKSLFTKGDPAKKVSKQFLDECIFIASEVWGEEYALKYLFEKYDNYDCSRSVVGEKLKMTTHQIDERLHRYGIKLNELRQNRYKVIKDGGVYYISMRNEEDIPTIVFTPKYIIETLGITRQGFSAYLNKRAKIPREPSEKPPIKMSPGVYRDILDSYTASKFRSFSVSSDGYKFTIRNLREDPSSPTPYSGVDLKRFLQVSNYTFYGIIASLNIPPNRQNRYWLSEKAFRSIVAIHGPK